jgi:hypothetical protein
MELRPSSELAISELAELFTAAYEDYYVPFQVDEVRLTHMVDAYDLALDRSLVAWDGDTPVGLANLGLRGEASDMSLPEARRLIAAARSTPRPWQRDDATVDNLGGVAAIAAEGAAAVPTEGRRAREPPPGGRGEGVGELIRRARARGPMLALNYPVGDSVTLALHDAGATEILHSPTGDGHRPLVRRGIPQAGGTTALIGSQVEGRRMPG